jgi:predicted porin
MKKTLIALAALTVTGAFAQSTVEIYGRAHVAFDASYSATGGTANVIPATGASVLSSYNVKSRQRVSDDSSRIGFRINEDLGGGLRAFSVIETGINIDTATANGQSGAANSGTGFFGTREAHVGIGNKTAEVRLGRQNVFWGMGPIEDVGANRISGGVGSSYTAPSSGFVGAPAARLENTIQLFAGSELGGFAGSSVWVAKPVAGEIGAPLPATIATTAIACAATSTVPTCTAASTTTTTTNAGNTDGEQKAAAQGFTLRYVTGPFAAQYDYGINKNTNNGVTTSASAGTLVPTLDSTIKGAKLGVAYTYAPGSKVYVANATFQTSFTETAMNDQAPVIIVGGPASRADYARGFRKQTSNQVGVQHRMGNLELHGQYVIQADAKNYLGAAVANTGSKAYALGARYELSKRTALTGSYNVIDNESANNVNISGGGQSAVAAIGLGATLKVSRVSIQHVF